MKNIMKHTKIGASLIALAFSLFVTHNVQAQSCATPPSCTDLGYVRSASDCATIALKCPFDQTKYYCLTADELADLVPETSNCAIGDILYSDKTCNANVVASKTPIGIVFDVTNKLAIALQTKTALWSTEYFDVDTLSNITSSSAVTADWQGKSNTAKVVAYCNANSKSCPAFDYVISYTTAGTKAGDWYLPAGGELNAIYGNMGVLNTALSKVGGTALPSSYHWSSSEHSSNGAWYQDFSGGYFYSNYHKGYSTYVRPVLAF